MKVPIALIGSTPLKVKESISSEDWGMDTEDIKFCGDINIEGVFERNGDYLTVNVCFDSEREFLCGRCLAQSKEKFNKSFSLEYSVGEIKEDYVDITEDIRQEILLNWPYNILCKESCRGICPGCGKNLNFEECICGKE